MVLLCCYIYCVLYYVSIYLWCGHGLCDVWAIASHAEEGVWGYQLGVYLHCTRRPPGLSLWVTLCLSTGSPWHCCAICKPWSDPNTKESDRAFEWVVLRESSANKVSVALAIYQVVNARAFVCEPETVVPRAAPPIFTLTDVYPLPTSLCLVDFLKRCRIPPN